MAHIMKSLLVLVSILSVAAALTPAPNEAPQSLPAPGSSPATDLSSIDIEVLNFALNLELLEAQFYNWAAYGYNIDSNLLNAGLPATGAQRANLSPPLQEFVQVVAYDEITHVRFLLEVLGSNAIVAPNIDLNSSFSVLANNAVHMTLLPPFSPYINDVHFLVAAFALEDTGVTAYKGALGLLEDPAIVSAAAGLLGTEAYHAGYIRSLIYARAQEYTIYPGVLLSQAVNAVSAQRSNLSGYYDDQGILNYNYDLVIAPVDINALVFSRNTTQVIAIVSSFFPNGLAGSM